MVVNPISALITGALAWAFLKFVGLSAIGVWVSTNPLMIIFVIILIAIWLRWK